MWLLAVTLSVTLLALALRRGRWDQPALRVSRWAYALFVLGALFYFPSRSGFQLSAPTCQWTFSVALAVHSLTNYAHIVLFAIFFLLTYAQLRGVRRRGLWSFAAVLLMGLFVELAQGTTGQGNCRMRDLVPDAAGALIGLIVISAMRPVRRLS